MTLNQRSWSELVMSYVPHGGELMNVERLDGQAAILPADLRGRGQADIAAVYRWNGSLYVLVLVNNGGSWRQAGHLAGPGYAVSALTAAPLIGTGRPQLLVGWRTHTNRCLLSVYDYDEAGLRDITPGPIQFSHMDVEDMAGGYGSDGVAELALWLHETESAYRVDIFRWSGSGLVAAQDAYPAYFPKVIRYYEELQQAYPDEPVYGYYLADAQLRTGALQSALHTVGRTLTLSQSATSRSRLLGLEQWILTAGYQEGFWRTVGLYPVSLKTTEGLKWGYMNQTGQLTIQPQFDDARDFEHGLAVVSKRNKYGLINAAAQFVVQPVYDSIGPFFEGLAVVSDARGYRLMNEQGNIITRRAYSYINAVKNGRAVFSDTIQVPGAGGQEQIRYGYLDRAGHEVIPAQYEEAYDFQEDRAIVKLPAGAYVLIQKDGTKLHEYSYPSVGPYSDGLMSFQQEEAGKYGYINERGDVVIQPIFTFAMPFQQGRAIVNTSEDGEYLYGVIDRQGRYIVQPEYNDIRNLDAGRLALGRAVDPSQPFLGSYYAIADWNGRRLTDFIYAELESYQDGLASATDGKETYFIDLTGRPAPGYPRLRGQGSVKLVSHGLIQAFIDQRLSYVTRAGQLIWQQNTLIPLAPPYAVREEKYHPNPDYLVYYPQVEGIQDRTAAQKLNRRLKELSQVKPVPSDQKLDYTYTGDFQVSFYRYYLLQLELTGYRYPLGAAHGMPSLIYAIINLGNGRMYSLKDLFKPGSPYVRELSRIVGEQIRNDPQYSYVFPDSYTGIKEDQPFYVTEDALHLYFEPYEIAPYAAGFPTFTIPFIQIRNLINTKGEFWQAFHQAPYSS